MAKKAVSDKMEVGSRKLTINTAAIVAAIWVGMFGYEAFANYMLSEQLFLLVALGLVMGAALTIAALLYGIKLAEIMSKAPAGTVIKTLAPLRRVR